MRGSGLVNEKINSTENPGDSTGDSSDTEISKYTNKYTMTYGQNYFPIKEYKGIKYDDGYYESLIVSFDGTNIIRTFKNQNKINLFNCKTLPRKVFTFYF